MPKLAKLNPKVSDLSLALEEFLLTCKHSAKSHRYRERQKLKAFLKNPST
ncbi:hypothetical protein [Desulfofundulus thermocisternus]|nr:hypothetical protein [Desulfofundulus thermocisternus]MBE3586232.1 hypothetical protein [Thermoanaerobacter sp.]MCS5695256.1 hypothetical protein [Desulfofundulus thermocisternus]